MEDLERRRATRENVERIAEQHKHTQAESLVEHLRLQGWTPEEIHAIVERDYPGQAARLGLADRDSRAHAKRHARAERLKRLERAKEAAERKQKRSKRAHKIFIMRREGATLAQISAEFGITRETVRQIFFKEERRILRAVEAIRETKEHAKNPVAIKFRTMPVSVRVRNCVRNELGDDATLAEVAARNEFEWMRTPNFGRTSLIELKECLASHGLKLGEPVPGWMSAQDAWRLVLECVRGLDVALAEFDAAVSRCEKAGMPADEVIAKVLEEDVSDA